MIWVRSLVSRSIFCANSGIQAAKKAVIIRMIESRFIAAFLLHLPHGVSRRLEERTSWTTSVNGFGQHNAPAWNFRAPLSTGECDNPVPNLAPARLNWEWTDTFAHDGRALLVAFAKYLAFSGHLGQEDEALVHLTVAIREMAEEENAPIPVDFDFAICEIGDLYSD